MATTSDGSLQLLASPADAGLARGLVAQLETSVLPGLRFYFSEGGNPGVLPPGRGGGAYQAFLAPPSEFPHGFAGETARYCEGGGISAVAFSDSEPQPLTVLAHELCHAFVSGLHGRLAPDSWFEESVCEFYALTLVPNPARQAGEDRELLSNSETPLDSITGRHEYSVERFDQWLAQRMGSGFYEFATETLRQATSSHAAAAAITATVRDGLRARGRSFADDLGTFWGDHLLPESEQPFGGTGPALDPDPVTIDSARCLCGSGTEPRLAATAEAVRLGPSIRQLRVDIAAPGADGRLWGRAEGEELRNASDDGWHVQYCVGETPDGDVTWPGELRFVLVNVSDREHSFDTKLISSTKPCVEKKKPPPGGGHHRRPPRRPRPRSCSGGPRRGVYESSLDEIPVAYLTYECVSGHRFIYVFGGSSTCTGTPSGEPVSFGPAAAGVVVEYGPPGRGDLRGSSFAFTYHYDGAKIHVAGAFDHGLPDGIVSYDRAGVCSFTQEWAATHYKGP